MMSTALAFDVRGLNMNVDCVILQSVSNKECATEGCNREAAPQRKICYRCKSAKFQAKNPEYFKNWQRVHHQRLTAEQKARKLETNNRWREENKERVDKARRERYKNTKSKIIQHYGGKCECCGEHELVFLTIDHKDGNGAAHRREIGGSNRFYSWLIKEGFPPGFRVLCFNCNFAEHWGGCPHGRADT